MPWQYVQGTGYVDSVPEDTGTLPVLAVMSATCTVQIRLNKTVDINIQKADGSQITKVKLKVLPITGHEGPEGE